MITPGFSEGRSRENFFTLSFPVRQGISGAAPSLLGLANAGPTERQLALLRLLGAGAATGSAAAGSFFLRPPATGNSSGA